jgi:hypothetical protein
LKKEEKITPYLKLLKKSQSLAKRPKITASRFFIVDNRVLHIQSKFQVLRSFVSKTRAKSLNYIKKFSWFFSLKCHNFWTAYPISIICPPVDVTFCALSSGMQLDRMSFRGKIPKFKQNLTFRCHAKGSRSKFPKFFPDFDSAYLITYPQNFS